MANYFKFIHTYFRPSKIAHAYKDMDKETNESPPYILLEANQTKNKMGNDNIIVDFAMRYGNPSINSKLNSLKV